MRSLFFAISLVVGAASAFADEIDAPPYTEAVRPVGSELIGVAIGPGGPDVEFGLSDTNGGLYRLGGGGVSIPLSDGQGLRNPTGIAEIGGILYLVDGNEVIAVEPDGTVVWRVSDARENVFFYDIRPTADGHLLVGDFGNGRLISVSTKDGAITDFATGAEVPGLARFAIDDDVIWAISWGSDTAWDGSLYKLSANGSGWQSEPVVSGFGNAEAVAVHDGRIYVGGYRGHETATGSKLMRVDVETGVVTGLEEGAATKGISDILIVDDALYLTHFRDDHVSRLPVSVLD